MLFFILLLIAFTINILAQDKDVLKLPEPKVPDSNKGQPLPSPDYEKSGFPSTNHSMVLFSNHWPLTLILLGIGLMLFTISYNSCFLIPIKNDKSPREALYSLLFWICFISIILFAVWFLGNHFFVA